jgi:hypothetical protein
VSACVPGPRLARGFFSPHMLVRTYYGHAKNRARSLRSLAAPFGRGVSHSLRSFDVKLVSGMGGASSLRSRPESSLAALPRQRRYQFASLTVTLARYHSRPLAPLGEGNPERHAALSHRASRLPCERHPGNLGSHV